MDMDMEMGMQEMQQVERGVKMEMHEMQMEM